MATVCRFSRTQLFPPQFRTLQDWFLYAFAESRLDGTIVLCFNSSFIVLMVLFVCLLAVEKFPSLERERTSSGPNAQGIMNKTPDYNHTAEVIFAFPSLQLHLKSEHLQSGRVPPITGAITEFFFFFFFIFHQYSIVSISIFRRETDG